MTALVTPIWLAARQTASSMEGEGVDEVLRHGGVLGGGRLARRGEEGLVVDQFLDHGVPFHVPSGGVCCTGNYSEPDRHQGRARVQHRARCAGDPGQTRGNIGRTCVVTGGRGCTSWGPARLLAGRAGPASAPALGYWGEPGRHGLRELGRVRREERPRRQTTPACTSSPRRPGAPMPRACYQDGDFLVFGCESVGLAGGALLAAHAERCERQSPCCRERRLARERVELGRAPGERDHASPSRPGRLRQTL